MTFGTVGVVGGGAWGTALAQTVCRAGRDTLIWAREPDVVAEIVAGRGRFDLSGAHVGDLAVVVNAGATSIDLTTASVGRLDLEVAAGSASIHLPASGDLEGELDAAAGSLELCRPDDLGLRIHGDVVLGGTTFNGLVRVGDAWQTPDYPTASAQADLYVTARAGSVVVDPEGGCK